jgi:hypothetical protein
MTNAVADDPQIEAETPQPLKTPEQLFQHALWVHVGAGAADCPRAKSAAAIDAGEAVELADCPDQAHFHAWIRLPNRIQRDEIQERALAAKARRVRLLNDPESDAATIMRDTVDALAARESRETVIEEILSDDWAEDRQTARIEVIEEADDGVFDHIDADIERYSEILAMDAEQRESLADELAGLERHLTAYRAAIEQKVEDIRTPRRARLEQLDLTELLNKVSRLRIQNEGIQAFHNTYRMWAWLAGTWKAKPASPTQRPERVFDSVEQIREMPDEVLGALEEGFNRLRAAFDGGVSGN